MEDNLPLQVDVQPELHDQISDESFLAVLEKRDLGVGGPAGQGVTRLP